MLNALFRDVIDFESIRNYAMLTYIFSTQHWSSKHTQRLPNNKKWVSGHTQRLFVSLYSLIH
jgi:hypothetical protein